VFNRIQVDTNTPHFRDC